MNAIIGLVDRQDNLDTALGRLQAAGFDQQMLRVLASCEDLREHVACSCQRDVFKDAAIGAGLIGGIYAVFGVLAAWGAILNGIPTPWSIGAAVVFLLIGLGMGAFGGALVGRAEAEKETHLYTEGVRRGAVVVLLWSQQRQTAQAIDLLRQSGVLGVMICTRARPVLSPVGRQASQPA
jgi:hypothetical protein